MVKLFIRRQRHRGRMTAGGTTMRLPAHSIGKWFGLAAAVLMLQTATHAQNSQAATPVARNAPASASSAAAVPAAAPPSAPMAAPSAAVPAASGLTLKEGTEVPLVFASD